MSPHRFNANLCIGVLILAFLSLLVFPADSSASSPDPVVTVTLMDGTRITVPWDNSTTLMGVIYGCTFRHPSMRPRRVTIIRSGKQTTFTRKYLDQHPETDPALQPGDHVEF